jgi:pyroglutamyl-peptidase
MSKTQKRTSHQPGKSLSKPATILLTGFDAFAGDKYNPSQLVVESFPDVLKIRAGGHSKAAGVIHISKQVLPTAGATGWKILKKALDRTVEHTDGPVLVLMLGLAATRKTVSLERFAMNFRDYSVADNSGEQRQEETIEANTPQLLRTNLDLRHLQKVLTAAGYPCHVSNHAGTFVCNELYFRALSYMRKSKLVSAALFVHLPLEKVFAKSAKKAQNKRTPKALGETLKGTTRAGKSRQLRLLQEAIARLSENIVQEIVGH